MSANRHTPGVPSNHQQMQIALARLSHIAIALIAQAGGRVELLEADIQRLGTDPSITVRTTVDKVNGLIALEIVKAEPPVGGG